MDRLIELSEELKRELDKLPLFQEYKRIKNLYENSEELKEYQKLIVRAKNENRLEDHAAFLKEYESHPLYISFKEIENDVVDYLKEITDELNKK